MAMTSATPSDKNETVSRSAQRRLREREQRLQTILEAAEFLFAENGFQKTSMEEVANRAEVSVGTVYFYFKNKQDLLVKLVEETGYRLRMMIGKEFRKSGETLEGFKKAGSIFFEEFCVKYPQKAAIMYRESVGQGDDVEACRKRITELLREDVEGALIHVGRNLGREFKSGLSAEVISVIIMGIYERIAYQYLLWQKRSENLKAIGSEAIGFIEGGINNLLDPSSCS